MLIASFLILIGPLGTTKGETILGNGFLINSLKQMAGLTVMTLVSATLILKQMALVFRRSHLRFDDLSRTVESQPQNWSWLQVVFILAAGFSLPLTCWLHSAHEIGGDFIDDPEFSFEKGFLGLALGIVLYFLLFLLTAAAHHALDPKDPKQTLLPMAFLEGIRIFLSFRFKKAKRYFQEDHFELFIDFLLLTTFYLIFYMYTVGTERTPEDIFTTPFYLVLILTMLSMALSATSYFLDYYRVPTMVVVLLLLLSGYFLSDFDHRFPVVRVENPQRIAKPSEPRADGTVESSLKPDSDPLCIIVVAPGGGIHASAWTGKVLTGLHDRYRQRFAESLKLISSVSGGAVGTMFYLDHFSNLVYESSPGADEKQAAEFQRLLEQSYRRSSTSSLESLAWGAAFPDTARLFLGNWVQEDRGMVQERRWLRRMDIEGNDFGPTIFRWREKAQDGNFPYVVFNATEAETGRRVLFSTFEFKQLETESSIPMEARAIDFLTIANNQFDLPISTAVRLSATFPYAAAAAMPAKDTLPLGHIVDGGYVDNEGLLTAIDFIRLDEQSQRLKKQPPKQYIIIRILHTPPMKDHLVSPTDPGLSGSGWEYASFGPLMAMSNVRATSQRERGEMELSLLKQSIVNSDGAQNGQAGSRVISVALQFTAPEDYEAPPLNWKLSPKQRAAYQTAWDRLLQPANKVLEKAAKPIESSNPTAPSLPSSRVSADSPDEFEGLEWLDKTLGVKEDTLRRD
ncbi:MAG: hypothetical protein ABL921_02215 [Pirellula sp.]